YQVTIDREVLNDRTNARYLVEENVRDGVHFDLSVGLETFIDKVIQAKYLRHEPCLHPLCNWAIEQPGSTLSEVFDGAEFAGWRGTMKRIAMSLVNKVSSRFVPDDANSFVIACRVLGQ
ncbi:hypothetical protein PMAYCL1PPCAC_03213, partial [Pristionchus mayeri]